MHHKVSKETPLKLFMAGIAIFAMAYATNPAPWVGTTAMVIAIMLCAPFIGTITADIGAKEEIDENGKVRKKDGILPPLIGWLLLGAAMKIPDGIWHTHLGAEWVHNPLMHLVSTAAVCLLLFHEAGIPVSLRRMAENWKTAAIIAIIGAVGPMILATLAASALGLDKQSALTFGAMSSPTSMAVTVSVLGSARMKRAPVAILFLTVTFMDDCMGLITSGALPSMVQEGGSFFEAVGRPAANLAIFIMTAGAIFLVARFITPRAVRALTWMHEARKRSDAERLMAVAVMTGAMLGAMHTILLTHSSPWWGAGVGAAIAFTTFFFAHRPLALSAAFLTISCAIGALLAHRLGQEPVLGAFVTGLAIEEDQHLLPLTNLVSEKPWTDILKEDTHETKGLTLVRWSHYLVPVFFAVTGAEIDFGRLFANGKVAFMALVLTAVMMLALLAVKSGLAFAAGKMKPAFSPTWRLLLWEMYPRGEIMCIVVGSAIARWPTIHPALPAVAILGLTATAALAAVFMKRELARTPDSVLYGDARPPPSLEPLPAAVAGEAAAE